MNGITQDLRTFTYSCVQMGLSDTGNTTAWAATAKRRMSIFPPLASVPAPTKRSVSTAPPPPGYAIWPGYNHRQKGCWLVTEILEQYIHLSGDFFFVFNEGNTRDILWALVACLVISCHKNGPLTFREYDILNVDLLSRKKKS